MVGPQPYDFDPILTEKELQAREEDLAATCPIMPTEVRCCWPRSAHFSRLLPQEGCFNN